MSPVSIDKINLLNIQLVLVNQVEKLDEIKRHYIDVERYDWVTDPKRLSGVYHRRRESETAKLVKKYFTGSAVLDIGCGTGLITRHLDCELAVGLDINRWAIERAKLHSPQAEFITGDAETLPLMPGVFDVVICTEILEHLPQPERMIEEISRVLKVGGLLIGSIPSRNPIWKFRRFLPTTSPVPEPFHHSYSFGELRSLLSDFKIIEITPRAFRLILAFVARKP